MKHPKKHLLILFSLLLLSLGLICFHMTRPQNIFEEIYRDEEWGMNAVFSSGVALDKVEGVEDWGRYDASEDSKESPIERYKKEFVPIPFFDVSIGFSFPTQRFTIFFNRYLDQQYQLSIASTYIAEERKLIRTVSVYDEERNEIGNRQETQRYLDQYGITSDDLESYYKTIMDDLILKDWISVYDSRFSPDHYGQVEIMTEW